jgi:hypothetical protein
VNRAVERYTAPSHRITSLQSYTAYTALYSIYSVLYIIQLYSLYIIQLYTITLWGAHAGAPHRPAQPGRWRLD